MTLGALWLYGCFGKQAKTTKKVPHLHKNLYNFRCRNKQKKIPLSFLMGFFIFFGFVWFGFVYLFCIVVNAFRRKCC